MIEINATYEGQLRTSAKHGPSGSLVETDAPFLTPTPHRGRVNASYLMPLTVRRLAELRGDDLAELCDDLHANTLRAFGDWA